MLAFTAIAAAALAVLPAVSAHGYVAGIRSGGKWFDNTTPNWIYGTKPQTPGWYAKDQDNGFVAPDAYGSGDIICHKEATPGATYVPVTAGSTIDLVWNTWPDSHHGPVIDYMARCNGDCTKVTKANLNFFKFNAVGLKDGSVAPGKWGSDDINSASNFTHSVKIPADIAPGNFILRHEIIALHSAGSSDGAQNYPQCINIKVTGSGSKYPCKSGADCRKGTALYKETDAGILINIYQTLTSYKMPGPAIWSGLKKRMSFMA